MTVALDRLRAAVGRDDLHGVRAPGRANLIGEHTDYNSGFVLPIALELDTYVVGEPTADRHVRLRSLDEPGEVIVDIDAPAEPGPGWGRYVIGVVRSARDRGHALRGFEGIVASDVPIGAGLSSSAALEVSVARAILTEDLDSVEIARTCRRAENVYVGAKTGIMDQLAAAGCERGSALFVDCLDESFEPVRVPEDVSFVIVDSAARRTLVTSAYNQRRIECRRAADALGLDSLRSASLEELEAADLDATARRRARHVVTENERVVETVAALRTGRLDAIGDLFAASQRSMSEDFEISTPEIDALVSLARTLPDVIGTRMTGGGFGGCTVNLVRAGSEHEVVRRIEREYERRTGIRSRSWISRPAGGASSF
jgi:galactokinase